jgi:AcrR family transcriptional regulator
MPRGVKKNLGPAAGRTAVPATGRVAQRNRTRQVIVDAAGRLLASGETPTMASIAQAAQVSRRTVYMYFPTLEQLLLDATIGELTRSSVEPQLPTSEQDPVLRAVQLTRTLSRESARTLILGRSLIRLTIEGAGPPAGGPRRGYRRIRWIEHALAPARPVLPAAEYRRLVAALAVLLGWESLIVLHDLCGIQPEEAEDILAFAVGAVVEKALGAAARRPAAPLGEA